MKEGHVQQLQTMLDEAYADRLKGPEGAARNVINSTLYFLETHNYIFYNTNK